VVSTAYHEKHSAMTTGHVLAIDGGYLAQ